MSDNRYVPTVPDLLSYFRILCVPGLLALAYTGYPFHFLLLFIMALISDVADGFLARRLRIETPFGAKLDSWADLLIYTTAPICIWWLWPDLVIQNLFYVLVVIISYMSTPVLGYVVFRKLPSLHLYSAKLGAVLLSASFLVLIFLDVALPFKLAACWAAISTIEEWTVIFTLDMYRSNVKSIFHLRKILKGYKAKKYYRYR